MDQFTSLFYGAIVSQILEDVQDPVETTKILHKLGQQMGEKMADYYFTMVLLNNQDLPQCKQFIQTSDGVVQYLSFILGVSCIVSSQEELSYQIKLEENPFESFVKVPNQLTGLCYSTVIPGAISGALKAVGWSATSSIIQKDSSWIIDVKRTSSVLDIAGK
ncbi:Bet3-like protein [Spironucleus salmonicida]|uniref:Bet3-like protein n=1 Tax=Spironucleus salmonicida TaxID=348837 RepID=V6LGG3_9EUKA|nr:Bet3-like protein [Spironucleus salmonicida]|eukprot:EST43645.1 Bet3-like protein [Spironucleus salmonicida]